MMILHPPGKINAKCSCVRAFTICLIEHYLNLHPLRLSLSSTTPLARNLHRQSPRIIPIGITSHIRTTGTHSRSTTSRRGSIQCIRAKLVTANIITTAITRRCNAMPPKSIIGIHLPTKALAFELPSPQIVPCRSAGRFAFRGGNVA